MANTHGARAERRRRTVRWALVATQFAASVCWALLAASDPAGAATGCTSTLYRCTLDGYNATTMNDSWAAKYYGTDTKGGIGTPPHNCTLFAAWMLARNGLPDPAHSWGNANQWGQTLAAETNSTPALGSIAWYIGGPMGHVAYVAHVNWTNRKVFLVSDNYAGGVAGYTSSSWVAFSSVTGFIHLRDLTTSKLQQATPPRLRH